MIITSDPGVKPGSGFTDSPLSAADGDSPGERQMTGREIILAWFSGYYEPTFHRGDTVYSAKRGRLIRRGEATCGADFGLVELLKRASDAPQRGGKVDDAAIPAFFRPWAGSAWAELLRRLPAEEDAGEIADAAEQDFRNKVSAALHTLISMGRRPADGEAGGRATEVERRSLIDWCVLWAKSGRWQDVRSLRVWVRKTPTAQHGERLDIALHAALFSQIKFTPLSAIGQNKFSRLAAHYGVGEPKKNSKANGHRCTILTPDFVASLLARPEEEATPPAVVRLADDGENELADAA